MQKLQQIGAVELPFSLMRFVAFAAFAIVNGSDDSFVNDDDPEGTFHSLSLLFSLALYLSLSFSPSHTLSLPLSYVLSLLLSLSPLSLCS
jgi:hypothetical protein